MANFPVLTLALVGVPGLLVVLISFIRHFVFGKQRLVVQYTPDTNAAQHHIGRYHCQWVSVFRPPCVQQSLSDSLELLGLLTVLFFSPSWSNAYTNFRRNKAIDGSIRI